jgi:hypothetical protein
VRAISIVLPTLATKIVGILSKRCCKPLKQVQGIIGQFRLTNRGVSFFFFFFFFFPVSPSSCSLFFLHLNISCRLLISLQLQAPTEPSAFLGLLFQPLSSYVDGVGSLLPKVVAGQWSQRIADTVAKKYFQATTKVLDTVKSTEDSLKRLKKTKRVVSGGAGMGSDGAAAAVLSDEDKIRLQFSLDAARFEAELARLGVSPPSELRGLVEGSRS